MESPVGVCLHDVPSETAYRISNVLLRDTKSTVYEQNTTANYCVPNVSIITEADIWDLIGRPIMTEEERLYRKILRRRPRMLQLAAAKGLLCDS